MEGPILKNYVQAKCKEVAHLIIHRAWTCSRQPWSLGQSLIFKIKLKHISAQLEIIVENKHSRRGQNS